MTVKTKPSACLICGSVDQIVQEKEICLCEKCLQALSGALSEKLPLSLGQKNPYNL